MPTKRRCETRLRLNDPVKALLSGRSLMYLCELIQELIAIFFLLTFFASWFRTNIYKLIYPCFELRGMQFFKYYLIIDS